MTTLCALIARMGDEGEPPGLVVSGDFGDTGTTSGYTRTQAPQRRAEAESFIDHWAPDLVIWGRASLSNSGLAEAQHRAIPSLLIDAGAGGKMPGAGWRPGSLSRRLAAFSRVLAVSGAAATRLVRLGAVSEATETLGLLGDVPPPPGCDEAELARMVELISPRPVWLAAQVPTAEIGAVLAAHQHASRQSPRLLLILAPQSPDDRAIDAGLRESHMRVAFRRANEDPQELHQIYVADAPDEIGLWLRLSPVTYLGGSLTAGGGSVSPWAAAGLGTALIHGRAAHEDLRADLTRLARAKASLPIPDAGALPGAVVQLLPPDQCARVVNEAWALCSAGAPASNRVSELLEDAQDGAL